MSIDKLKRLAGLSEGRSYDDNVIDNVTPAQEAALQTLAESQNLTVRFEGLGGRTYAILEGATAQQYDSLKTQWFSLKEGKGSSADILSGMKARAGIYESTDETKVHIPIGVIHPKLVKHAREAAKECGGKLDTSSLKNGTVNATGVFVSKNPSAAKACGEKFKAAWKAKKESVKESVEVNQDTAQFIRDYVANTNSMSDIPSDFFDFDTERELNESMSMLETIMEVRSQNSVQYAVARKLYDMVTEKIHPATETKLDEAMTAKQKAKKEEIVLAMKKNADELKAQYGDKWESVMYATATKQALKEGAEQVNEDHGDGYYVMVDDKEHCWCKTNEEAQDKATKLKEGGKNAYVLPDKIKEAAEIVVEGLERDKAAAKKRIDVLDRHISSHRDQMRLLDKNSTSYKDHAAAVKRYETEKANWQDILDQKPANESVDIYDEVETSPEDIATKILAEMGEFPGESVDDEAKKQQRMGYDKEKAKEVPFPKEVKDACLKRIKEIEEAASEFDEKGYNDNSMKQRAVECIKQIMSNLEKENFMGWREANVYYATLMSPITDFLPAKLINFITKGYVQTKPANAFDLKEV